MGGILKGIRALALAVACALFATTADASAQLDQSTIPETGFFSSFELQGTSLSGDPAFGLGQSVTAGLTGRLVRIDLFLFGLALQYGPGRPDGVGRKDARRLPRDAALGLQ